MGLCGKTPSKTLKLLNLLTTSRPTLATSKTTLQRANGRLIVRTQNKGNGHALAHLMQEGCLKARFPKMHHGGPKRGVLINTTGGVADGDRLATFVDVGENSELALTTQAAERIYRARNVTQPADMMTCLSVARGASLYWLPQETIVFEGAGAHRRYDVNVAKGACFLGGELLVLGRTAMPERVVSCNLFDRWRIRVGDTLAFADGFRLCGRLDEHSRSAAQLGDNVAYANLFYVGAKIAEVHKAVREVLANQTAIIAGCSRRNEVLICRFASTSSRALNSQFGKVITAADEAINGTKHLTQAILPRWIF